MTALLIILSIILIAVVAVQIGKVSELASTVRGEEEAQYRVNRSQSRWMLVFMVGFLGLCIWSSIYYKNYMMGFGPHESASEHGIGLDKAFWLTTVITGIVFFLTHIALFWYAYSYRAKKGSKAQFISHDNKLEIIWAVIPAAAMAYLAFGGLDLWNNIMDDIAVTENVVEIEAMGYQFAWNLRYPGPDGELGKRDFQLTTGTNPVGQDWTDEAGLDDFHPNELWLPVMGGEDDTRKVRVKILARDVLHDFWLPHFRVKMDAVPGMPTYFVFTPTKTTDQYRQMLRQYPEYNIPDPNEPDKMLWETFEYELACAELCGIGHWSMRKLVKVVSQGEYDNWLKGQKSYYMSVIHGTDADPWPINGQWPAVVAQSRKQEFTSLFDEAMQGETKEDRTFVLKYVTFETGSAVLTEMSKNYELANVVAAMKANPNLIIELGGHTDNTGNADANQTLSQSRAEAVFQYLTAHGVRADHLSAVGYGQTKALAANDTEDGRAENRRTEFTILSNGSLAQVGEGQ